MEFQFFKMHGAGNDFVVVLDPEAKFGASVPGDDASATAFRAALCAPRTGIDCEGLILMQKATAPAGAAFRMVFFNPDGSRASMCGNGARCAALCAFRQGWAGRSGSFATDAGPVEFSVLPGDSAAGGTVTVGLGDVAAPEDCGDMAASLSPAPCPAGFDFADMLLADTGVPHAVKFVDDAAAVDVKTCGAFVRYHKRFRNGTNADFVQVAGPSRIILRTYERGVEDETPACGTGVAASAVVAVATGRCTFPVTVRVAFGVDLQVGGTALPGGAARGVTLTGPAAFVCRGSLDTDWFHG